MADFGGNVEETYIYTYAKNLAFKAQQMNSRLFNSVLSDSSMEAGGKLHKVEQQWFPTSLDEKTTRFQDTNLTEMQSENRWYRFKDFNKAIGIDESDVKRSLQDPQSAATQTLSMAWARASAGSLPLWASLPFAKKLLTPMSPLLSRELASLSSSQDLWVLHS